MKIEINETIPEGKQRFVWPWDSLKNVGDYFVVTDPKNVRNGRQSVHQKNLKLGEKRFKGSSCDGGFRVELVLDVI